jgi:hypothetical protein
VERRFTTYVPVGNGIMQMNLLFQAFYSFTSQVGLGWTKICTLRKYNKIHLKMKLLPVAIGIMNSVLMACGSLEELTSGDLLASDDDVTVSPR